MRASKQSSVFSIQYAVAALCIWWMGALAGETNTAKEEHWSLKAVRRPDVPGVAERKSKARNAIDNFVFEKLAEARLTPSPEASRRVLIRRLYFDLIGLPPAPKEVEAFERDKSPDAYEKIVEQLLASPRYGERWAQHWLDVARFAETHGFEMNQPRATAWRYRDYVIKTFNDDKPYDRFIKEQFAGDALGEDAATGFLVAGSWDQVKSPDPVLTAAQRADELHDMVSTTGSAFLGLTVGCARCHNHKFDPIPQADYYAIKACLAGVQHGERKLRTPDLQAREQEAERSRAKLASIEETLAQYEPLVGTGQRRPVNARRNVERFAPVKARFVRFTISRTTDAEPCIDELEVYANGIDVALASAGTKATASSVYPNSEIHRIEHLNDGRHGNSHSWISNERGKGWAQLEFTNEVTINLVVWGRDREQQFSDRLATEYRIEAGVQTNDWRVIASSEDRVAYGGGSNSPPDAEAIGLSEADARAVKELLAERKKLEARIKELSAVPMAYAGTMIEKPEPTNRLQRGDPMQKREVVEPGGLSAVLVQFRLDAAVGGRSEDQQRRLALAEWVANPSNPLPARVMVNRLWQHHFGEGLVSTPSDFGRKGIRPSHPELLDWLAAEFMAPKSPAGKTEPTPSAWSIKHIQRLIVTSTAYRQGSAARPDGMAADAGSRMLWRFPPLRLEAEPLRDAILAVSGKLDLRTGGPGFSAFEPNDNYVRVYAPKKEYGPPEWRRMIYMTKVRMQQDSTFGAFDCPDGGQIAPKRMRSTTPLQALNLMNSGFMLQQAGCFAERLEKEAGKSVEAQVKLAFELAYGREPERQEVTAAKRLISASGMKMFCRALFNSNEFLFVD